MPFGQKGYTMKNLLWVLFFVTAVSNANEGRLDPTLAFPPSFTANEIRLADAELDPSVVNNTKIAYASDFGQRQVNESGEAQPSYEMTFSTRRGKSSTDSYNSAGVYAEVPMSETTSFWVSLYTDPTFRGAYAGLAKKYGNWQIALGGGSVEYDDVRHTVVNPWVFYSSDEYEALVHAEYYHNEVDNQWWYKGYIEKKFNTVGIGLYGEAKYGIGPRITWAMASHVKWWVTVPMLALPDTERSKFTLGVTISF